MLRLGTVAAIACSAFCLWLWLKAKPSSPPKLPDSELIRVLLPLQQPLFLSSETSPLRVKSAEGLSVSLPPQQEHALERRPQTFTIGSSSLPSQSLNIDTNSGHFQINGESFTGSLNVSWRKDHLELILSTPLEHYVARVVQGEMKSSWPMEALRAQAIAARSFAIYHMKRHPKRRYHLFGDSRSQAFATDSLAETCHRATQLSSGLILNVEQRPLLCYYHSTCGGNTRHFKQGGVDYPSVICGHCQSSPHHHWQTRVSAALVHALLKKGLKSQHSLSSIELIQEASGHNERLLFHQRSGPSFELSALSFRKHLNKAMGKEVIKSLTFNIEVLDRGELLIQGRGWGYHGIGLCQYGARGLAAKGKTYEQILQHYYPMAKLQNINGP